MRLRLIVRAARGQGVRRLVVDEAPLVSSHNTALYVEEIRKAAIFRAALRIAARELKDRPLWATCVGSERE